MQGEGSSFTLDACRFSAVEIRAFDAMFKSSGFSHEKVDRLRRAVLLAPPAPPMELRLAFHSIRMVPKEDVFSNPAWAVLIGLQRSHFTQCLLQISSDVVGVGEAYAFPFAFQTPHIMRLK